VNDEHPSPPGPAADPRWQILVRGLHKSFGAQHVLRGVDLDVERGKINIVIGGSGQGKSVLMKHLMGLMQPDTGRILVDGEDIVGKNEVELGKLRRKFGMVFQYSALLDSMNVLDNLAFPLREHTKMREREIREKIRDKLSVLGLEGIEKRFPSQLSGGMKKRVGLARALMLEPAAIMYDEPTSGLDPLSSRLVDDLIVQTRDRFGVTSIVISHDMAGALRIADHIHLLSRGRIETSGTPEELVSGSSELAKEFFESSGIAADRLIEQHRRNGA
jgi:phospholipid/cholesterol/gamma-HCH transport system ATP-binding protein